MAGRIPRLVDRWLGYVADPPAECVYERRRLMSRAAGLASEAAREVPSELDIVVAGSGFLSLYFLGVHSVLSALQTEGRTQLKRYAGASSGAQTSFEIVLSGEEATIDTYLSHGLLADRHASSAGLLQSAWNADKHWRAYGDHLVDMHADKLVALDGRVFVSISKLRWNGLHNAMYSSWSSRGSTFAKQAFYATGTLLTHCDGCWCTDGGVTNNTPLFEDGSRAQLLVRPSSSGLPLTMAMRFSFAQAVEAMERGQDDAIALFRDRGAASASGSRSTGGLKLIPPSVDPSMPSNE